MARNDPYLPTHQTVADGGSVTFDGSEGETGAAIVSGLYGNFDAQITLEASDDGGTSWSEVALFEDENGEKTFASDWATQFNRLMVAENERRIKVSNVDSVSGEVALDGDER